MRHTKLKFRRLAEVKGTHAISVWQLRDKTVVYMRGHIEDPLIPPEPGARRLLSGSGGQRLDTADGRPHFGDIWAADKNTILVQIGDEDDFDYSAHNEVGRGQEVVSSGNLLQLRRSDFRSIFPFTLTRQIPGIEIVNDHLIVRNRFGIRRHDYDLGWMVHHSISFDAASNAGTTSNSTISVPHTVGAGSNKHLFSTIFWDSTTLSPTSCVFNTTETMSLIGTSSEGASRDLAAFGLVAPSSVTADVAGTISGTATNLRLGSTSRFGVNQTTPTRIWGSSNASSATTCSVIISDSQSGDVVVSVICDGAQPFTPGGGQTQRYQSSSPFIIAHSDVTATGAPTTMTWTTAFANSFAMGAVALTEAPGAFAELDKWFNQTSIPKMDEVKIASY